MTVCPSAPVSLPVMANPACAPLKLMILLPAMALIEIEAIDIGLLMSASSVRIKELLLPGDVVLTSRPPINNKLK